MRAALPGVKEALGLRAGVVGGILCRHAVLDHTPAIDA